MTININGTPTIISNTSGNGVHDVYLGDTISVILSTTGCSGVNDTANSYTDGIIVDAACTPGIGNKTLTSYDYTVVSGDIGNQINLYGYSVCSNGCT